MRLALAAVLAGCVLGLVTILGPVEVTRKLASGGFGDVYSAIYDAKRVAIKLPHRISDTTVFNLENQDPEARQDIFNELSIYKALISDLRTAGLPLDGFVSITGVILYNRGFSVVPLDEFPTVYTPRSHGGDTKRTPVAGPISNNFFGIVMEECQPFSAIVSPLAKVSALAQSAMALGHLHSVNYLYRDFKPRNLLQCRSPTGEMTSKITDFGSVHSIQDGVAMKGQHIFTFAYAIDPYTTPIRLVRPQDIDTYALAMSFVEVISPPLFQIYRLKYFDIQLPNHPAPTKYNAYEFLALDSLKRVNNHVFYSKDPESTFSTISSLLKDIIDIVLFPDMSGRYVSTTIFSDTLNQFLVDIEDAQVPRKPAMLPGSALQPNSDEGSGTFIGATWLTVPQANQPGAMRLGDNQMFFKGRDSGLFVSFSDMLCSSGELCLKPVEAVAEQIQEKMRAIVLDYEYLINLLVQRLGTLTVPTSASTLELLSISDTMGNFLQLSQVGVGETDELNEALDTLKTTVDFVTKHSAYQQHNRMHLQNRVHLSAAFGVVKEHFTSAENYVRAAKLLRDSMAIPDAIAIRHAKGHVSIFA